MKRKESWYAVIGGVVGSVLTIAVCSFSPLGAQSQTDLGNFDKVTCRRLIVEDTDGEPRVMLSTDFYGGYIGVLDKSSTPAAGIRVAEHGGGR